MTLFVDIAALVRLLVSRAEASGLIIDDDNIVDLLADNLSTVSLNDIRDAIVVAGLACRFPKATRSYNPQCRTWIHLGTQPRGKQCVLTEGHAGEHQT